jgi:DNA-binding protein HU-beta|tara:strand:+ start:618 stop:899 length:282 start_codon:yes stop_codon:yes gene_type:complete
MNRIELAHNITEETGLTKEETKIVLESIITNIVLALKKGDKVMLKGFGSWSVVQRNARMGIVPSTGQAISIPAKKIVKFIPSVRLNEEVKDVK